MGYQTKATLKSYFTTTATPTSAQFADLIDSGFENVLVGSGAPGASPTETGEAAFYYDKVGLYLYAWNGAAWAGPVGGEKTTFDVQASDSTGTPAAPITPPASPVNGDQHIEVFNNRTLFWDRSAGTWVLRATTETEDPATVTTAVNYTVVQGVRDVFATGGVQITLPNPALKGTVTVARDACTSGDVTVVDASGAKIDNSETVMTLASGRSAYTFQHDGTVYRVVSSHVDPDVSTATLAVTGATTLTIQINTTGVGYTVDWGDATSNTVTDNATASHTYGSAYTGNVTITVACGLSQVTAITSMTGEWSFNLTALSQFPSITSFTATTGNLTTGDIANLPAGLTYYYNTGSNTTSGSIASLPAGLTLYANTGSNTTSGNIASLPAGLTYYNNQGSNTTSGNIASLPAGLTYHINTGSNTTSGSIASLPAGLTYYNNAGSNTTSGSIASLPAGLTLYANTGSNTTSGNIASLPAGLTYYNNAGSNTTSGSIASLPAGLTFYANTGSNTTSGNIASLPAGLTYYSNAGSNTTSGSIASLPAGLTVYYNTGSNTVTAAIARTFPANSRQLYSRVTTWTSGQVDALLINAAATTWATEKLINIGGTNAARTAASNAAVVTLTGMGVTVTTN